MVHRRCCFFHVPPPFRHGAGCGRLSFHGKSVGGDNSSGGYGHYKDNNNDDGHMCKLGATLSFELCAVCAALGCELGATL